jgi:hypothetical protein
MAQLPQRPTDKMRAEASLHADDARRQLLEGIDKRQTLDLPAEGNTSIRAEADNVKDLLANVDADGSKSGVWGSRLYGCFSELVTVTYADYHLRGSSRSIPLAAVKSPFF